MNAKYMALTERADRDPVGLLRDASDAVHANRSRWNELTEEQQRALRDYDFHRGAVNHRVGKYRCTKCLRTAARVLAAEDVHA